MARGNNERQSSVRSEVGATNALSRGFTIGGASFKTSAPRTRDEERSLKASLKKLQGFDEFGFTTQTQNLSTYQSAKGYDNETFTKQASNLADLLNDMVAKGQGGSKLFKEIDSLYQDIKTARGGNVGKTTKLDGGRVYDASGDNFNLASKVGGFDETKKWFNAMKKAELTAGEMFSVVENLQTTMERAWRNTKEEDLVAKAYIPVKYRGVNAINSPVWFEATLETRAVDDGGWNVTKVRQVKGEKERIKAINSSQGY